MTTSVVIKVPKEAKYKAQVLFRNSAIDPDGYIVEQFDFEYVMPGENKQFYIWKGRSMQVNEIGLG